MSGDILSLSLALLALVLGAGAQVGPGAECLCFQEVGDGLLYNPVTVKSFGDGSGRILVAEQRGMIWIFDENGDRNPIPYLDMNTTDIFLDLGLLNMELHPDYANNGRIYLHYTALHSGGQYHQRISEMTRSATNPDEIDVSTERIVWDIDHPYDGEAPQHVGGGFAFGLDGYLYAGFGDGHCCYDPLQNGQNKSTPQASVVRIDVDSRTGDLEYGIPSDNPFLDDPEAIPELFAYGIRQAYTMAVDQGDPSTGENAGRIYVGDVGEVSFEEVIELFPGHNYGWPHWEGPLCHDPAECSTMGNYTEPIVYYNRTMGVCVILSGIYRGCLNPDLNGWMLFLDYANPVLFGATEQPDGTWTVQIIPRCQTCPEGLTNIRRPFVLGSGSDENGEFWFGGSDNVGVSDIGASVYKIVDPNNPGTCPSRV